MTSHGLHLRWTDRHLAHDSRVTEVQCEHQPSRMTVRSTALPVCLFWSHRLLLPRVLMMVVEQVPKTVCVSVHNYRTVL